MRSGQWRTALFAVATVAAIMVSHELLETARDALFLARLPASQLPWVYLIVAGLGLAVTIVRRRRAASKAGLPLLLITASVITAGAWLLVRSPQPWVAYALYVWTALLATLAVTHFWLVASRLYTATDAKRIFSLFSLGAIAGAILGSVAAWILVQLLPVSVLVLAAAVALAAAAGFSLPLVREETRVAGEAGVDSLTDCLAQIRAHPYVRRLALLVVVSVALFTCLDYLFKSVVAERVAPAELGTLFASLNIVVNVGSLVVQLLLVRWLLARAGVTRALSVLPALVFGGTAAVIVGGGLIAVLVTKAFDGSLRYSLHRTAVELLYVPMPDAMKRATKVMIDILGHRGAQALTSIAILMAIQWAGAGVVTFAVATALLAVAWLLVGVSLREHYLDLFRSTLLAQSIRTRVALPELDLRSLETLIRGLNSSDDREVLAAIELLEEQGRAELVPDLILYHPSPHVVLRALDLFDRMQRTSCMPIVSRLLLGSDSRVRAAALRIYARQTGELATLRAAISDGDPAIRATALTSLAVDGDTVPAEVAGGLDEMADGNQDEQRALARAIFALSSARFAPWLERLGRSTDRQTRIDAARAMAEAPDVRYFDALVRMLAEKDVRPLARRAIVNLGISALAELDRALDDTSLPRAVRQHIPRTMSRFAPAQAAPRMLVRLLSESDGLVRFKLLRGLGRLSRENPRLQLDPDRLDQLVSGSLAGALRALHWKMVVTEHMASRPADLTPIADLLLSVLRDRERNAIERVSRCLGLMYPAEDFEEIYRGIRSGNRYAQSSGHELLAGLLRPPVREAVLALVSDEPDEERLAAGQDYYAPTESSYEQVLDAILERGGEALRSVAAYHAAELGLRSLQPKIAALEASSSPLVKLVGERSLEMLQQQPAVGVRYV